MSRVLKVIDADGDPTAFNLVVVPEGFSLQMYDRSQHNGGYQSVIISPEDAERVREFLRKKEGEINNAAYWRRLLRRYIRYMTIQETPMGYPGFETGISEDEWGEIAALYKESYGD